MAPLTQDSGPAGEVPLPNYSLVKLFLFLYLPILVNNENFLMVNFFRTMISYNTVNGERFGGLNFHGFHPLRKNFVVLYI